MIRAMGVIVATVLVVVAMGPGTPPASANHVLRPACDSVRQDLIAASTAYKNANDTYLQARALTDQALGNVATARAQLVAPVLTYIAAVEDQVGVAPAQAGFESSLVVFTNAVSLYISRLDALAELQATRDLNGQVVQLLEAVRQGLEARLPCPAVPLDLVLPL